MHAGQVVPDPQSVAALVAEQFPQWGALPVRRFPSDGTVNALFRLGDGLVARFPLLPTDDPTWPDVQRAIQAEVADLGTSLAVGVPVLRGLGRPGDGYPGHWSVYEWLPGEPAAPGLRRGGRARAGRGGGRGGAARPGHRRPILERAQQGRPARRA